ncbi:hemerythrin domain-containing protein [Cellvibrio mixtus]|uniref:hemerythrin domain-containing protein n=1 Tax=Cellvibrio mixtus TaxID=39650 RepID=UPI0005878606|nr:hemerythrin domain-containing protein [Cellvibrio mixtus]
MTSSAKKIVPLSPAGKAQEATRLLRADHKHVSELFEQFESARSSSRKKALVQEICQELTVHAQIEEEIFYPAIQPVLKDKTLVPEAKVEHETLKYLIAQIEDAETNSDLYDAKVKVLSEYVQHHVKEEQNEIFPQVKQSKLDLVELGAKLAQRKEELLAKLS